MSSAPRDDLRAFAEAIAPVLASRLTPREAEVLYLHVAELKRHDEIAAVVGISRLNVDQTMRRAMRKVPALECDRVRLVAWYWREVGRREATG